MRRANTAIAGVALCAITANALALPPPPYVVGDIAYTHFKLGASELEAAGQPSGSDRSDTGLALTAGWRFTSHLAAEVALLQLGTGKFDLDDPVDPSVSNVKVGVKSSGFLLSLAGTWPVNDKLSLEGRAGAYFGKTKVRVSGDMAGPFGNQRFSEVIARDSRTSLAVGVGAVVSINDSWAVRGGYDYLDKAFGEYAGRVSLGVRYNWP